MQWNIEDIVDYNQAFTNESNFIIRWLIKSWYAVKQIQGWGTYNLNVTCDLLKHKMQVFWVL